MTYPDPYQNFTDPQHCCTGMWYRELIPQINEMMQWATRAWPSRAPWACPAAWTWHSRGRSARAVPCASAPRGATRATCRGARTRTPGTPRAAAPPPSPPPSTLPSRAPWGLQTHTRDVRDGGGGELLTVLRIRIRDPVPFRLLDPGWVKSQDPGWTTRIKFPRA